MRTRFEMRDDVVVCVSRALENCPREDCVERVQIIAPLPRKRFTGNGPAADRCALFGDKFPINTGRSEGFGFAGARRVQTRSLQIYS